MTDTSSMFSSDFDSIISKGFVDVVFTQSDKDEDLMSEEDCPRTFIKKMNI